jgi:ubiquinone biosynthesis protein UbiJ
MKNFILSAIEKTVNAYLQQDKESSRRLAKMAGKSLGIELLPLDLHFNCHVNDERITLTMDPQLALQTKIKGTPLQLVGVLIDKDRRHQFFADDLTIEGDAEFAQEIIDLFDNVNIDWEEQTSRVIGDAPAYHLNKLIGNMKTWFSTGCDDLTQDMNDYLHEEKAWFPVKEQLQEFFTDIDTLRMDTDRLSSRVDHLQAKMKNEEAE